MRFADAQSSRNGIDFPAGSSTGGVPLQNTTATIADIDFGAVILCSAVSLSNFVTFIAAPAQSITLTTLASGQFSSALCGAAPAAGQGCTPVGSAFSFVTIAAALRRVARYSHLRSRRLSIS